MGLPDIADPKSSQLENTTTNEINSIKKPSIFNKITKIAYNYYGAFLSLAGGLAIFSSYGEKLLGDSHTVYGGLAAFVGIVLDPIIKRYAPFVLNRINPERFKYTLSERGAAQLLGRNSAAFIAAFATYPVKEQLASSVTVSIIGTSGILAFDAVRRKIGLEKIQQSLVLQYEKLSQKRWKNQ